MKNTYPMQFNESDLKSGAVNPDGTMNMPFVMVTTKRFMDEAEGECPELTMSAEDIAALIRAGKPVLVFLTWKYQDDGTGEYIENYATHFAKIFDDKNGSEQGRYLDVGEFEIGF